MKFGDLHIFSLLFHPAGKTKATQHAHLLAISIRGTWGSWDKLCSKASHSLPLPSPAPPSRPYLHRRRRRTDPNHPQQPRSARRTQPRPRFPQRRGADTKRNETETKRKRKADGERGRAAARLQRYGPLNERRGLRLRGTDSAARGWGTEPYGLLC